MISTRLGVHLIQRLDSVHTLLIDEHEIKLTPSEYRLILRLLAGRPVSNHELAFTIFSHQVDGDLWAREAVDRHLVRVRRKFRQNHLKLHIVRIPDFGYMLVSSAQSFPKSA